MKNLKEDGKLKSDGIENELLEYIKFNIVKLRYITIKKYKNSLKPLKESKEIELLREQETNEIKKRNINKVVCTKWWNKWCIKNFRIWIPWNT